MTEEGGVTELSNFFIVEIQTMLFEHINILTGLGFPFAHTDVIHTAHVHLKTKFNHAFKTSKNLHPFHPLSISKNI